MLKLSFKKKNGLVGKSLAPKKKKKMLGRKIDKVKNVMYFPHVYSFGC